MQMSKRTLVTVAVGSGAAVALALWWQRRQAQACHVPAVAAGRRRLEVGHVDGEVAAEPCEEERGSCQTLDQQSLTKLLGETNTASRGSDLDDRRESFKDKKSHASGLLSLDEAGLGYTCRKGLKPDKGNSDSWFVVKVKEDHTLYGVMNGHGQQGHTIANFVRRNLPKLVVQDPRFEKGLSELPAVCLDAFEKMQRMIEVTHARDAQLSGTTATLVIHDHRKGQLTIAHVGDSSAVLVKSSDAVLLTRVHKPDLPDEKERIEKTGGRVVFDGYANHRVYVKNGRYPGLNMSRALGDILGREAGLISTPEVKVHDLGPDDQSLLICSDGVWEFIEPRQAADVVREFKPEAYMAAADALAKRAWDRWIQEEGGAVVDDITVILTRLAPAGK